MPDERRQFRVLYRDFLLRVVDLELLSAGGEMGKLLGQLAAVLAALNLVFAVVMLPRYTTSRLPHARLMTLAWGDEEFLIATTMAVAGLFAVLAWNVALPDRRESLVLGLLPVRTRTVAFAKIAAIGAALGMGIVAVNLFTGLCYPFLADQPGALGAIRSLVAYWLVLALSGVLICGGFLAIQGVMAQVLSYRLFLRASSWVQLAALFATLSVYFLKPPFGRLVSAGWLPSFWFFGLYQQLNGAADPMFARLAARACWSLVLVLAAAGVTLALSYRRNMRRIIEQPDIAPADRSRPAVRVAVFTARRFLPRPIERAIVLFIVRGMARSRQHRLVLAAYAGVGFAIALTYCKDLLSGTGSLLDPMFFARPHWNQPNVPLLAASLVLMVFAVVGTRAVFTLPIALPANWIFRITAVHSPASYFPAVRKALFVLAAAPLWIGSAVLFFAIWPARAALMHVAILAATAFMLVEIALYRFLKLPFACSYLPGKANVNVRLGMYLIVLLTMADLGTRLEFWTMERLPRFAALFAILVAAALWARRRTVTYAASPHNQVQFEDLPPRDLEVIDLHGDTPFSGGQSYVDLPEPT